MTNNEVITIPVNNWDVLTPPPGKVYKNKASIEQAWIDNADFVHARTGRWCSQREIRQYAPGVEHVIIRYGAKMEKTYSAWVKQSEE